MNFFLSKCATTPRVEERINHGADAPLVYCTVLRSRGSRVRQTKAMTLKMQHVQTMSRSGWLGAGCVCRVSVMVKSVLIF
jgi:hypothetical protein